MANWSLLIENYYKKNRRWNSSKIDKLILEVLGEVDAADEESQMIQGASNPEAVQFLSNLLKKSGYDNAKIEKVLKSGKNKGSVAITNLGTREQRQAIQTLLSKAGKDFDAVSYKELSFDGQRFVFIQGGGGVSADGEKIKQKPNRGDVSEAFIASAIMLRFLHLPEVATKGEDGEIKPARGLVTTDQIKDFIVNGYKGVKPELKNNSTLVAKAQIASPSGAQDTIEMEVGLREYSMAGLMDIGNPKAFVNTDKKVLAYLNAAAEYANREIIKWAVGVVDEATEGSDPSKSMGWFINDFNNVIKIRGVGTENQTDTKVDLAMTCSKPDDCPLSSVSIDGAGDLKGDRQLARLSLKAGTVPHFGGGAATSVDAAIGVMESVFSGGKSDPAVAAWIKKHEAAATFADKKNQEARTEALKEVVAAYAGYVEKMMGKGGVESDRKFLDSMVDGVLNHSVKGKNEYAKESGVLLVQSTDKGDFYKIDFGKLPEVFGNGSNFSAKATMTSGGSPYLVIYQSVGVDDSGKPIQLGEPSTHKAPNVLFWIRTLARTGQEILRLEKGALMKKVAGVEVGGQLVYRDGKLIEV